MRLVQLAKAQGATYSRYADDLTFSTSQTKFPVALASPKAELDPNWILGGDLTKIIERTGFATNKTKVRMQYRTSRQMVTGLTVNSKANIQGDKYRTARSMCHSLFKDGAYHLWKPAIFIGPPVRFTKLKRISGILSFIYHV